MNLIARQRLKIDSGIDYNLNSINYNNQTKNRLLGDF